MSRSNLCAITAIIRHSEHPAEGAAPQPLPAVHTSTIIPRQADNDEQLIELWLHGRSEHTQRAYRADARRMLQYVGKQLRAVTLGDLQSFADDLNELALKPRTKHRILSATKSLFSFARRIGYLSFDVGKPLHLPTLREELSERILDEGQVQRMIALERHPRNHAILMLLYSSGVRVSELCGLRWRDCQPRDNNGGQITVLGKGGQTRAIKLPPSVWRHIASGYERSQPDSPVFRSRKGGGLKAAQVTRIVRKSAERAGIPKAVSAHWLRHAHASHALDRQAPIHLVQQTLGHASVATTGRYLHARPNESSSDYLSI